jgi:hypothetical protein
VSLHCSWQRERRTLSNGNAALISRLELARDEVDRVFGNGHAAAHPELVVAIVHAASSDWAARVICAALEDIAMALVEGGVELPGSGLVAARSIVRP